MKLSIIIPALNEEAYISNCINSIKTQLKNNTEDISVELIVVNNGSTDNTKNVAEKLGIKVIDEPIRGLARAKNSGAKHANGEYILFVDADNVLPNTYLNTLLKLIRQHPDVTGFTGPSIYLDGGIVMRFFTETFRYYFVYYKVLKLFCGFQSLAGGNTLIKKEVFEQTKGFDENINSILVPEDLEFGKRLHKLGYKVLMSNDLYVYTSFRRQKRLNIQEALVKLIESIKLLAKS